jgi:hypothetical protein
VNSASWFPGRVLLSRDVNRHSTIGAEGLNCRVRDGNGCFPFAMTTGNLSSAEFHRVARDSRQPD